VASHEFNLAWAPVNRLYELQLFVAGLATVMPTTSLVEGDFSLIHYRRNEHSSALSDIALEGVLHAKQLRDF